MNALPNIEKAVKPSGIIQHGNRDTRLRWISKDAVEVGKYYYIFLRTYGREFEPGLPGEQEHGVWLIGKVTGVYTTSPTRPYPSTYKIDYTHALLGMGEGVPTEYVSLGDEGEGHMLSYSHIQSPSETGLPPERTVARFYVPEQMGGRMRMRRRTTGQRKRRHQRKRTVRRRRV